MSGSGGRSQPIRPDYRNKDSIVHIQALKIDLPELASILLAAGIVGTIKKILLALLAVLNGILAMMATLAIWKSYLITGAKILFTLLVLVPVVGVVAYLVWGQRKVADAR